MLKNRSLLIKYFLSYLIFLVPIIVVLIIINNSMLQILKDEIASSNIAHLKQIQNENDTRMDAMIQTADRICLDDRLTKYGMMSDEYAAMQGINELKRFKSSLGFLEDLLICFGDDVLFSTHGRNDFRTLAGSLYNFDLLSQEALFQALYQAKMRGTLVLNTPEKTYLIYYFPIPRNDILPTATVVMLVDTEEITNLLISALRDYDGLATMTLDSGMVAASVSTLDFSVDAFNSITSDSINQASEFIAAGKNYIEMGVKSDQTGSTFRITIQNDQIFSKVAGTRLMVLLSVLGLTILSIVVSYFLSMNSYRPIKRLRDTLDSAAGIRRPAANELDAIQRVMAYTIGEKDRLERQYAEYNPLMRQYTSAILFLGIVKDRASIEKMLVFSEKSMPEPYFCVCTILASIRETGEEFASLSRELEAARVFEQPVLFFATEISGSKATAAAINFASPDHDKRWREKVGEKLLNYLKESGFVRVTISFGQVYNDITLIRRSYIESCIGVEDHSGFKTPVSVVYFDEIATMESEGFWFSRDDIIDYEHALGQRDENKVFAAFRRLISRIPLTSLSDRVHRFLYYSIMSLTFSKLEDMGIGNVFLDDVLRMNYFTKDEFSCEMELFLKKICATRDVNYKDAVLREKMLRFLEDNFRDANLSLEMLATAFGMSKYSLCRFFKEQTGKGYIEYLSELRINEAKRLLQAGCDSVKTIIHEIGYYDLASFNKKFKSITGMNPAEYRKMYECPMLRAVNDQESKKKGSYV